MPPLLYLCPCVFILIFCAQITVLCIHKSVLGVSMWTLTEMLHYAFTIFIFILNQFILWFFIFIYFFTFWSGFMHAVMHIKLIHKKYIQHVKVDDVLNAVNNIQWITTVFVHCTLSFRNLGSIRYIFWILLFSKDALYWSKVTVKPFCNMF